MTAILSLLLVVTLSILVTRIAAVALRHTGLARQTARFQARSAFSGAGFTTSESEKVVNHPVRRRTGDATAHQAAVAEQDRVASRERVRSGRQEDPDA